MMRVLTATSCLLIQILIQMLACRAEIPRDQDEVDRALRLKFGDQPATIDMPGFRGRVTKNGIDYASELVIDFLMSHVQNFDIPPQKHNVAGSEVEMNNIQIVEFGRPTLNVSLIPGYGLAINVTDISALITANYSTEVALGFWTMMNQGVVTAEATNNTFSMLLMIGHDAVSRRPVLLRSACLSSGPLSVAFEGDMSSVLNLGTSILQSTIQSITTNQICETLETKVNQQEENLEEETKMPVEEQIADTNFTFDFGMVRDPEFTTEYLQTFHKGITYYLGRKVEPPFLPEIIPQYTEHTERMVYMYVTDYVINAGLYAAHLAGKFEYNVEESLIPEGARQVLRRVCHGEDICLGKFFPVLARRYFHRDGVLRAHIRATEVPHVALRAGGREADFRLSGDATLYLHVGERGQQEDELLSVTFTISSTMRTTVNGSLVQFNIVSVTPSIEVSRSNIGQLSPGEFGESIDDVINTLKDTIVLPKLRELGAKGIPLPKMSNVELANADIIPVQEEGILVIASDFDISIPCNITVGNITSVSTNRRCGNGTEEDGEGGTTEASPPAATTETSWQQATTRRRRKPGRRTPAHNTTAATPAQGDSQGDDADMTSVRPTTRTERREWRRRQRQLKKAAREEKKRRKEERKRQRQLEREQRKRAERERRRREHLEERQEVQRYAQF